MSDGAKAALTGDELGSMRLWPTLDGTREPRVIDLPRAKKLALGAHGDGFVAAIIDDVGGVIVASLDPDGKQLGHVTLPIDPPYSDLAMTSSGALAWRSDQVLQLVDAKTGVIGTLPAEPGTRILAIAASGDRAIAIVDAAGKHKARWITHTPKLAWGAWVPMHDSASLGATIALSPSGKRLVTTIDNAAAAQSQIIAIDAATGKLVASTPGKGPVGFIDDDHLAIATGDGATWFDLSKPVAEPTTPPNPSQAERAVLAAGGGRAITTTDAELVIAKPGEVKYLGYEMLTPAVASAGPKGQLLIGLNDTFAMLDTSLRQTGSPSLALPAASTVSYLAYLGNDDWLVQASKIADGSTSLALVDVAKGKSTSVKDRLQTPEPMQHEASTQLITLSLGDAPEVLRFDPQTRKLVHVASPAKPKGYEQIALAPLSPALANGNQLVAIRTRDRVKLSWIKDATKLETEASTITIDGSFAGVDPAGHVFVWQNNAQGKLEIVVYGDGKKLGVLPTEGQTALWPDPSGQRVIEITPQSVGLFGLDGKRAWIAALSGANEAVWLADGSIAVVTSAGVARLDPATGAIAATRCGWRFGLSAKPHPQAPHLEPVCAQ